MTFYEVRARTIINRVPPASPMAFRWTINPYRGCSHACAYCLAGETRILMADGRTKALAEVHVGDAITYSYTIRDVGPSAVDDPVVSVPLRPMFIIASTSSRSHFTSG